jgi:hypothetical protein
MADSLFTFIATEKTALWQKPVEEVIKPRSYHIIRIYKIMFNSIEYRLNIILPPYSIQTNDYQLTLRHFRYDPI